MVCHRGFYGLAGSLALVLLLACNGPSEAEGGGAPSSSSPSSTASPAAAGRKGPATNPASRDTVPGYRLPPSDVVDIVDAAPTPLVRVAAGGQRLAQYTYESLPGIDVVTRPFERLAGLRIDAARHARRRTRWYTGITFQTVADGATTPAALPAGVRLTRPAWSPDGSKVAFTRDGAGGLELWVADAVTGEVRRVGSVLVNDVLGAPFVWMPGSTSLLIREIPADLGPAPTRPVIPGGPVVEDTAGKAATTRTYQDLLRNADDEAQFEHFATCRLGILELSGELRPLGGSGLVSAADPSPDGKYVLVERLRRPFSYAVPYYRFARVIEVLDAKAKVVRRVADQDVADEIPIQGVRTGPRRVHWQPGRPATLVWTEALDGGDPRKTVEHRDRVMSHAAPFADTPEERLRVQHRLVGLDWTERSGQVLVTEYDRDRRWRTTRLFELDTPEVEPRVLFDRSSRDVYGDPGDPVTKLLPDGTEVVIVDEGSLFLAGSGASPEGNRPFLDRYELATGTKQRLLQSEGKSHTVFVDFVGEGYEQLLIRREAADKPPDFFVTGPDGERRLTRFPDPHPQLTGIHKRLLSYKRRDGVPLSGTLYLPPSYEEGQRLPLVVWAYPLEYNDGDTAGQVRAAPRRFTRLSGISPLMFLTQGYAVLSGAAMPVVGDPETMNDTFLEQVAWAAEAAIDAAVEAGVADRDRVGVGGHSYGAFMTANLLAHSDLFRAGIARSGAYNRSLTPFGFQSERRTLWEAPQTYVDVSPLFAADKIDEPLLLIHGEVDNNSGTFPLQSRRLFHALKGNGATARLVMLPGESHGYVSRESVLHVLAESFEWFDRHVKNAEPRGRKKAASTAVVAPPGDEDRAAAGSGGARPAARTGAGGGGDAPPGAAAPAKAVTPTEAGEPKPGEVKPAEEPGAGAGGREPTPSPSAPAAPGPKAAGDDGKAPSGG